MSPANADRDASEAIVTGRPRTASARRTGKALGHLLGSVGLTVLVAVAAPEAAATARDRVGSLKAPTVASHGEVTTPRVSGSLDGLVSLRLRQGYAIAVSHLRKVPTCRALFANLGTNGLQELAGTVYYASTFRLEKGTCGRGAVAMTSVGSPQTRLCRAFGALDPSWAAMILVHEALHFAGMGEKPRDASAMTSPEINRLVKTRCNF